MKFSNQTGLGQTGCDRFRGFSKQIWVGLFLLMSITLFPMNAKAVIRDGGVDPNNLGQGGWLYIMEYSTNKMFPNNISSVTNENSLMAYLKSQGLTWVIVKAATSNLLWTGRGNVPIGHPSAQFNTKLVNAAHANGLLIFGSNRSWGNDIPGEIAVADYVFQQGADGFIYDAEAEWESTRSWIGTNGPALAWQLCSTVRSNWPTKFIAHNPFDTVYLHFSFPFKEFGYWCDAVMPQVYHHAASKGNAIAAIHWNDIHYQRLHTYLSNEPPAVINGKTIYWTNSIKPLVLMRDVYNGGSGTPKHPDTDVRDFLDYMVADPNCADVNGYNGSDYFRSELHSPGQWAHIKASTIGKFSNVVNNIILDDARATRVGSWNHITTITATISTVNFVGETGADTNSFGTNYWYKAKSPGTNYMEYRPNVLTAGDYLLYEWHPTRATASTNVPFVVTYSNFPMRVFANQTTNNGSWSHLGMFPFAAGSNGAVQIFDTVPEATAIAMVDGLKMVYVKQTVAPTAPTNLVASMASSNTIALSWADTSTNESSFVIMRSTTNNGPYTNIAYVTANSTNFSHTGLPPGTVNYYVVRAANSVGMSTNSNQAFGTTASPPVITNHPPSQLAFDGGSVTFTVGAGGIPLTYKWRKNGVPLVDGGNISGATTATLTLNPVSFPDEGDYSVVITNVLGSVTSSNATLSIGAVAPEITADPTNQTVNAGLTVNISAKVTGTSPLSFRWKKNGTPLSNGGKIFGADTRVLMITNVLRADQGDYFLTVSNSLGSVDSAAMTLTVRDPAINAQPLARTNLAGTVATFTVNAAGTPALLYRWMKDGTPLTDGGKITGATTAALTIDGVLKADAGMYSVSVTNGLGGLVSSNAKLTVVDPVITNQPTSLTNISGTPAVFSVGVAGTLPINFQWRKGTSNLLDGPNIIGANTPALTILSTSMSDAGTYNVRILNSVGALTSSNATLVVFDPVNILTQPLAQSVFEGVNVEFSVVATGTPVLTYQWRFEGADLPGATNTNYVILNAQLTNTGNYSVAISNIAGVVESDDAFLQVSQPFRIDGLAVGVRPNNVVITWTTTSNSTSQVEYGLTPDFGNLSALSVALVTNHVVMLTGLIPDTNYYFRVLSTMPGDAIASEMDSFISSSSFIVDDPQAFATGPWTLSTSPGGYGGAFAYSGSVNGTPTAEATFIPNIDQPGRYDVYLWFSPLSTRSKNVPVFLSHKNGNQTFTVDQTVGVAGWHLLTTAKEFGSGPAEMVQLANDTGEVNRPVVADAVRWAYDISQDNRTNGTVPGWWENFYFGTNVNASADPDGDGYSSYQEYVIGSLPTEGASRFNLKLKSTGTNSLAATFSPRLDMRFYELQESTNMVIWQTINSNMVPTMAGEGTFALPKSPGNKFYRVKIRFP